MIDKEDNMGRMHDSVNADPARIRRPEGTGGSIAASSSVL